MLMQEPTQEEQDAFYEAIDALDPNASDEELDAALNALPPHIRAWGIEQCEIFMGGTERAPQTPQNSL